jgi:type I restriction enzyme, S subunit
VSEWKKVRLGDSVNIQRGYAFKSKDYREKGVFVLRVSNLTSSYSVSTENAVFVPETFLQEYKEYQLEEGDILLVMVGATTGKIARVPKQVLPALLNQNLWNLKPQSGWNKDFFFYMIQREIEGFLSKKHGSAREFLKQSEFLELEISCPSLPEQRKIAAILSSVDEAIEKTEAIIEKTEKVKKGLMQQLLTKGIGHTKFKKTEIGEIPEEWEVAQLGEKKFTQKITQGPNPKYNLGHIDEKYRALKTKDLYDHGILYEQADLISKETFEGCLSSELKDGDILVAIVGKGSIGKSHIFYEQEGRKYIFTRAIGLIRVNKNVIYPEYLHQFFQSEAGKKIFEKGINGSTGQEVLQTSYLKEIKIPLPPFAKQIEIVRRLETLDKKIQIENGKLIELNNLKKGLMQVLLTGKVRVKVDDEVMSQ